jgi:hypothetical protein
VVFAVSDVVGSQAKERKAYGSLYNPRSARIFHKGG